VLFLSIPPIGEESALFSSISEMPGEVFPLLKRIREFLLATQQIPPPYWRLRSPIRIGCSERRLSLNRAFFSSRLTFLREAPGDVAPPHLQCSSRSSLCGSAPYDVPSLRGRHRPALDAVLLEEMGPRVYDVSRHEVVPPVFFFGIPFRPQAPRHARMSFTLRKDISSVEKPPLSPPFFSVLPFFLKSVRGGAAAPPFTRCLADEGTSRTWPRLFLPLYYWSFMRAVSAFFCSGVEDRHARFPFPRDSPRSLLGSLSIAFVDGTNAFFLKNFFHPASGGQPLVEGFAADPGVPTLLFRRKRNFVRTQAFRPSRDDSRAY